MRAFLAVGDHLLPAGSYVFGDKPMQNTLDTTALAAITLGTTAATTTKVVEAFDSTSFIATNTNATLTVPASAVAGARMFTVTTNAVAADTLTVGGVTLTATSSTTDATHFAVGGTIADTVTNIKTALAANSTVTAKYTPTNTGATFTLTETTAGGGNTPAAATYTGTIVVTSGTATTSTAAITSGYLAATVSTSPATVVSNAYTVSSTDNYAVLKVGTETLGTGTISYYISRDNGTTFVQIYPGTGVFIGAKPTGTSLVFKVVLTGTAKLTGGLGIAVR